MKIDVVVCTYNRGEKLKKAIQSILDAEVPENNSVQLIIINNNSSDNTESVIKQFSDYASNIKIKYLFEGTQGKSHALNIALKNISGDLIAFSDDDQIVDKYYIKEMANALKRYPEYNCFGGKVVAMYPDNMPQWFDIDRSMKFLKSVFGDKNEGDKAVEYGTTTISKTPGGGNMFFKKEALEKNGFFRTDLGPVGNELGFSEDTEYCQGLLDKGEKFMYIPSVIVYHPVHIERLKKEYLLNWQYKCGRSEVRRNGGYNNVTTVFGIPRYLLKKCMTHAFGCLLSPELKKRFYHKLKLYYTVGELQEYLKIRHEGSYHA